MALLIEQRPTSLRERDAEVTVRLQRLHPTDSGRPPHYRRRYPTEHALSCRNIGGHSAGVCGVDSGCPGKVHHRHLPSDNKHREASSFSIRNLSNTHTLRTHSPFSDFTRHCTISPDDHCRLEHSWPGSPPVPWSASNTPSTCACAVVPSHNLDRRPASALQHPWGSRSNG